MQQCSNSNGTTKHVSLHVMPALGAGIHAFCCLSPILKAWLAGTLGKRSDAVFDGYARP